MYQLTVWDVRYRASVPAYTVEPGSGLMYQLILWDLRSGLVYQLTPWDLRSGLVYQLTPWDLRSGIVYQLTQRSLRYMASVPAYTVGPWIHG